MLPHGLIAPATEEELRPIELLKQTDCFSIPDYNLRPCGQPVNCSLKLHTFPLWISTKAVTTIKQ